MGKTPGKWVATYKAETSEELDKAYQAWASEYDQDTVGQMGYVGPTVACELLHNYLDSTQARILDAGCGTGLVGEALKQRGYSRIEAMDYSQCMLDEADNKNVYKRCFQADMNDPLDVADNTYDASICVGTFTYAHVGPQAFNELVRVTRPGGVVCFTVRDGAYQDYGYRQRMLDLEAERMWQMEEMLQEPYLVNEDVSARFCAYKVLEG